MQHVNPLGLKAILNVFSVESTCWKRGACESRGTATTCFPSALVANAYDVFQLIVLLVLLLLDAARDQPATQTNMRNSMASARFGGKR